MDVWWDGMVGDGCSVDTSKYFAVCANVVGSCYGSAGKKEPLCVRGVY